MTTLLTQIIAELSTRFIFDDLSEDAQNAYNDASEMLSYEADGEDLDWSTKEIADYAIEALNNSRNLSEN